MSVAEIGQLHGRYVRLSDKFKAVWTFNQLATGIFRNLMGQSLPYEYDFPQLYERVRASGDKIQTGSPADAAPLMDDADVELNRVLMLLIQADAQVPPSILRRFFEKLRGQDEKILFNLIKFYLYAGGTTGSPRDKLDFLLTRVAELWDDERGEFTLRELAELRRTISGLLHGMEMRRPEPDVAAELVREFHELRDQVNGIEHFDELTSSKVLSRTRELKQQIGDAYFDPEILLAIIDCNIATKNRFARVYQQEEGQLVQDAQRLMENEQSIAHGFGDENPEILEEIRRFKEFKQEFDQSRAESNLKHDLISNMKLSMSRILTRLDEQFDPRSEIESLSEEMFMEEREVGSLREHFGDDALLQPYLSRIIAILESVDPDASYNRIAGDPVVQRLRLEPWEISSFEKIYWDRPRGAADADDLLYLFIRGAALRLRIDEEARELAESDGSVDGAVIAKVRQTLERSREFDDAFRGFLQEQIHSDRAQLHRVYRSRLRLLRAYSGLWLIYDQQVDHSHL